MLGIILLHEPTVDVVMEFDFGEFSEWFGWASDKVCERAIVAVVAAI